MKECLSQSYASLSGSVESHRGREATGGQCSPNMQLLSLGGRCCQPSHSSEMALSSRDHEANYRLGVEPFVGFWRLSGVNSLMSFSDTSSESHKGRVQQFINLIKLCSCSVLHVCAGRQSIHLSWPLVANIVNKSAACA